MAASGTSSALSQKAPQDWSKALVYAFFEWLLIFVLFVDAIFSYIITKFAYYCGLQAPCLLCSRIDHVLGKERLGYHWDLFCGNHKSEISSLVLCRSHNKLVDVHGMCESCLFSFATINRSNAETYRLLVGKLGDDPKFDFDQDPLLGGHNPCSSSRTFCSCCNQPWISRGHSQKLIQKKILESEAELDVPVSHVIERNHKELRKQDEPSMSVRTTHIRDSGLHPLSHVGYTELKVNSDTESEVHYSDDDDDDDASALIHEGHNRKKDLSQYVEPRVITPASRDPTSAPEPPVLVSEVQVDLVSHDSTSVASTLAISNGLEELNWQQVESKADVPASTGPVVDSPTPSSNAMKPPIEVSKQRSDVTGTREIDQTSVVESGELYKEEVRPLTTSETGVETNPVSSNADVQVTNVLDLGDAYKLVVVSKGKHWSGGVAEKWIGKDSSKPSEDLKVLLSQLSANRGLEQSTSTMSPRLSANSGRAMSPRLSANSGSVTSPRLSANSGDLKASDTSNSFGMQILSKRISLERNESGLSLDGSVVSEIEGESIADRLKRQVEHDKKIMSALYKELEEERNASAIASDQAMAMITRLQEEKAALHMEALQQLRMIEEQAEYDNEALQKTEDLLVEKEKEIQDLEAELELYRIKYPNESMLANLAETTGDIQARDIGVDHSESSNMEHSSSVHKHVDYGKPHTHSKVEGAATTFGDEDGGSVKTSLLDFEDEKKQILQYLEILEKSLSLFSTNGVNSDSSEGDCSENGGSQEAVAKRENDLPVQHEVSVSSSGHTESLENSLSNGKGQCEIHSSGPNSADLCQVTDLASLRVLSSNVLKRLKTLEADREFLEHTINSLRYGEEGPTFIQDIASYLGELRKIGIRRDQTSA